MDREVTLQAMKAGIAGTAVLSFLLILIEAQTRSRVSAGNAIVGYVGTPGQQALGVVVFLLVTVVLWPLLFLALERRDLLPGRTRTIRLVLFALALALAFALAGRGDFSGPVFVLYGVGVLVAHVAYGLTLARLFRPIAVPESDPESESEPRAAGE